MRVHESERGCKLNCGAHVPRERGCAGDRGSVSPERGSEKETGGLRAKRGQVCELNVIVITSMRVWGVV